MVGDRRAAKRTQSREESIGDANLREKEREREREREGKAMGMHVGKRYL